MKPARKNPRTPPDAPPTPQAGEHAGAGDHAKLEALAETADAKLGIDASRLRIWTTTQSLGSRVKTLLIGKPRDLADTSIYHTLSLAAFLAWVGLGADGLSSSAYGPAEAFGTLINSGYGDHTYLAIFLALATAITVFVISACYSHIIEEFPSGGGGYLVASKLLGPRVGVVSGCALLVDYVLTITVSIAAAGDALFGLLGTDWTFGRLTPPRVQTVGRVRRHRRADRAQSARRQGIGHDADADLPGVSGHARHPDLRHARC